jgi:hypothetical protein
MARTLLLWLALSWLLVSPTLAKSIELGSSSESSALSVQSVKRADKYWLEDLGSKGRVRQFDNDGLQISSLMNAS